MCNDNHPTAMSQIDAAMHVLEICSKLQEQASAAGLPTLAYLLELAAQEAEGQVRVRVEASVSG